LLAQGGLWRSGGLRAVVAAHFGLAVTWARTAFKFVLLSLVDCAAGERIDGLLLANDEALWHADDRRARGVADRAPVLTSDAGVCVRVAVRHSAT